MKHPLLTSLRIVIPVLLLGWVARQVWMGVDDPERIRGYFTLDRLPGLAIAVIPYFAAVTVTFWRWYILVRAIQLPFRFRDALRLGFVGYFLQFFSLGAVGGDLFKAVFLAREQPNRAPEAVATVFIDRAVGMFGLLLITSAAFVWLGWDRLPESLHLVAISCFVVTATGGLIVLGLLWTTLTTRPVRRVFRRFPRLSAAILRGEHAVQMYRTHRQSFVLALISAMCSHGLLATSAYVISLTVTNNPPQFGEQMVIYNIAGALGTLPLSPGGLGTFEAAYAYLYEVVPEGGRTLQDGFIIALILRFVSVAVAGIGIVVYWISHREMKRLLDQAESLQE